MLQKRKKSAISCVFWTLLILHNYIPQSLKLTYFEKKNFITLLAFSASFCSKENFKLVNTSPWIHAVSIFLHHFCKKWLVFSRIFCTIFAGYYFCPLCVHSSKRCRRVLVSFISSSSTSNPAVKPNVMKRRTQTAHYVLVRRYRRGFHWYFFLFFFVAAFYSISRFSPHMAPEGFAWRKFQNDHDRNYKSGWS